ncbi:pilus assembly protein CpaE [Pigmentiphaga sp.]|mgnify:CR=1 FL=1|uniref:AAA family ATPase n=1 Tax=Pigmentiphaga sp. TaxID=1977564 RepID=UPI0025D70E9A|nr:pilus assembly protein CpaE [Pigmentiphaga sp.]MBX6319578.1 pilus assembly protein CpaE [Pigmentiphaga sp.]
MNAPSKELASLLDTRRFLFFTGDSSLAQRLAAVLRHDGVVVQEDVMPDRLSARLAELAPQMVLLDFGADDSEPGKLAHASELARTLARIAPALPVVAVGSMMRPQGAVAALRAGVSDFIDPVNEGEVRDIVRRVLHSNTVSTLPGRGQMVVLLGVRAGVGASTLAAHLCTMAQVQAQGADSEETGKNRRLRGPVAFLDLGLPVADGQLYLNVSGSFHFAEAVRNVRRLDETLVNTAVTRSSHGVAVISLPRDLSEMRTVSHADSLALLDKLRQHFGLVVADVGGFSNPEFVAGLVRAADQAWLVTDQSVGALVSLADMLRDLDGRDVDRDKLRLVVNRYDERYGMTGDQIAQRFDLRLLGTLPDRVLALMNSTNQGRLLCDVADRDPYVRAVQFLVDSLGAYDQPAPVGATWLSKWLPGLQKRLVAR